jgi:hypothetical protein
VRTHRMHHPRLHRLRHNPILGRILQPVIVPQPVIVLRPVILDEVQNPRRWLLTTPPSSVILSEGRKATAVEGPASSSSRPDPPALSAGCPMPWRHSRCVLNVQRGTYNGQPPLRRLKEKECPAPFSRRPALRPYPALRSLPAKTRRMWRGRVGNSRRIAHKQRRALHPARRPAPAALDGPSTTRENPVFIRPTASVCSSHPPAQAPRSRVR